MQSRVYLIQNNSMNIHKYEFWCTFTASIDVGKSEAVHKTVTHVYIYTSKTNIFYLFLYLFLFRNCCKNILISFSEYTFPAVKNDY